MKIKTRSTVKIQPTLVRLRIAYKMTSQVTDGVPLNICDIPAVSQSSFIAEVTKHLAMYKGANLSYWSIFVADALNYKGRNADSPTISRRITSDRIAFGADLASLQEFIAFVKKERFLEQIGFQK